MFEFLDGLMVTIMKIVLFCLLVFVISVIVPKLSIWWIAIILIGFSAGFLLNKH